MISHTIGRLQARRLPYKLRYNHGIRSTSPSLVWKDAFTSLSTITTSVLSGDHSSWASRTHAHLPPQLPHIDVFSSRSCFSTSAQQGGHATKKDGSDDDDERSVRQRAQDLSDRTRQRASDMREQATEKLREVREDPAKSARSFGSMVRNYGPVFVGTYMSVYFCTLGLLFAGVQSGALDPISLIQSLGGTLNGSETTVDFVAGWMQKYTFLEPYAETIKQKPMLGNFAVSWFAVKFTEPIRLSVALAITPSVARFVGWTNTEENLQSEEQDEIGVTQSTENDRVKKP